MNYSKNIKIFYAVLFAIVIFFIYKNISEVKDYESNTQEAKKIIKQVVEGGQGLEKDTDGDGLKDWEENLYNTSISNADTDGDGINDKEEIFSGRDPKIYGVGNLGQVEKIEQTTQGITTVKQQKIEIENRYQEQLQKQREIEAILEKGDQITEDQREIIAIREEENRKIKNDLNNIASIILKNTYKISNGVEIFSQLNLFFAPDNQERLTHLESEIDITRVPEYVGLSADDILKLKKLSDSYKKRYLNILDLSLESIESDKTKKNMLSRSKGQSENLDKIISLIETGERENTEALDLIFSFSNNSGNFARAMKETYLFKKARGISFEDTEPGNIFDFEL